MNQKNIRNFCIIAHIDHGKSTLADRFLELTGAVEKRKMQEQLLDTMSIERERGITVKMQPVRMMYNAKDGQEYMFNLIDTPGHVDFGYEVSRSLAAVEGAILLVDATKGTQAQTLANLEQAQKQGLYIIPVINKIDLPNAQVEETKKEVAKMLNITPESIAHISGKTGEGVPALLERVVDEIPHPKGIQDNPCKALIFDSSYDAYKGVVANVRVVDGEIKKQDSAFMIVSDTRFEALEVGIFRPAFEETKSLHAGEIGYVATGLKDISKVRVGDTITLFANQAKNALIGYMEPKRVVFASFFPQDAGDFDMLRDALGKLKLNDASFDFSPEQSDALGRGFRCGFLGVLHMDIIKERLKREYDITPLVTIPSVSYLTHLRNGTEKVIYSPSQIQDQGQLVGISEPYVKVEIVTENTHMGAVMKLLDEARGAYKDTQYLSDQKLLLLYEVPLAEIIIDFYDKLKSATSGYASLNYEVIGFVRNDLVKMDILVAGDLIEPFAQIVPRQAAERRGRALVERLKEIIPKQLFSVSLQATLSGKIIARADISAMRKDVTGYLYGGDITRKKKLLEKQRKGKQKMKARGRVNIPPETYFKVLQK